MAKRDVFISYKTEDFESASWVRSVLETNGISCWMAPEDIPGGSSYAVEIPLAIQQCGAFVVILSQKAQESKWIPKELDQAINYGKIILPFMLENISLKDDFNFYLSNVQRYAAYEDKSRAMEKMIREIRTVLSLRRDEAVVLPQEEKAKRSRKPLLWALIAVLAVGLAVGGAMLLKNGVETDGAAGSPMAAATAIPTARAMNYVTLEAPGTLNVAQYSAALSTLRGRLDTLVGEGNYAWTPQEGEIELLLPTEAFGGLDPNYVFRCYICRPCRLFLMDSSNRSSQIPLDREEIDSVTLMEGVPEGVDASATGIPGDGCAYLQIALKDSFVQAHQAEYGAYETPVLAMDTDMYQNYCIYSVGLADGGRVLNVADADFQQERFAATALYNMTHEPLAEGFYFSSSLNMKTGWQVIGGAFDGKNQVAEGDVPAPSVTFSLAAGVRTAGEQIDMEASLKERLDAMGVPYAFGTLGSRDRDLRVVIKIDAAHMGVSLISLIGENYSLKVRGGDAEWKLWLWDWKASVDEQGGPAFILRRRDSQTGQEETAQIVADLVRRAQDAGETFLTVGTDSYPLFCVNLEDVTPEGQMTVKAVYTVENNRPAARPLEADEGWLGALMAQVCDANALHGSLLMEEMQINPDADGRIPGEDQLALYLPFDRQALQRAVDKARPGAVISIQGRSMYVFLRLPVDDRLAQQGADMAKTIYQELDFEHLALDRLGVYLIDEDETVTERARISFYKSCVSEWTEEAGGVYATVTVENGRLEGLGQSFREAFAGDAFYDALLKNGLSHMILPE